jgi:hypothetical protein
LLLAGYLVAETPLVAPQSTPQITPQDIPLAAPLLSLLERLTTAVEGIWQELQLLHHAAQVPQGIPQSTPQAPPRPKPRGTPDVDAVHRRMQTLQSEGLTLAQIAARLTQEGFRTQRGRPWHKSTVSYVLRTHGR